MSRSHEEVRALWRERPRNRFLRVSGVLLLLLLVVCWATRDLRIEDLGERFDRLSEFFRMIRPEPIRDQEFDLGGVLAWFGQLMENGGLQGGLATLSISVVAIVVAMAMGLALCFPAARNLAVSEPLIPDSRPPTTWHRLAWRSLVFVVRTLQIFLRSIPEYMWAFLLIALLGPATWPWPAILALALHNAGILGRLTAETVENTPPGNLIALRALGASRSKIIAVGILPACFPRFLLYFFYRWETCVREATVLGLVGTASLGFLIQEAKVGFRYDEMVAFILVGSLIVIVGDFLSAIARRMARLA